MSTNPLGTGVEAVTAQFEKAAENIRQLTEQIIEAAKKGGQETLDAYQKSLASLVDFEKQAVGGTQLDWVSALASAHAKFIEDVTSAYVAALRPDDKK